MNNLEGKRIVVTGASRGIGAGVARFLAARGARIAITYTSQPAAADAVLKSLAGGGHLSCQLDVTKSASVDEAFKHILTEFGGIDALVNNAGVTRDQLLMRMKEEEFDTVVATNLRGAFLCCKAVMRTMLKARGGVIVNVSSVIGQMGNAGQSNYAASKAGLEGFTRSVALEVGSRGIRVNAVAPGYITTDMTDALDEKQRAAVESRIPLARLGGVDDVAAAVAFLIDDQATYITGQVLQVNGGLYM